MMPVSDTPQNQNDAVNYKKKYKALKRKLRLLVYEQECFMEELKKAQRKILRVTRDKSFLLDRLLQYERVDDSSSDSEATATSESDAEGGKEAGSKRKKSIQSPALSLPASSLLGSMGFSAMLAAHSQGPLGGPMSSAGEPPKKKLKGTKKKMGKTSSDTSSTSSVPGHMTREELERHLEMKQSSKPQFMSLGQAPHSLPDDIFSHENSNQDAF